MNYSIIEKKPTKVVEGVMRYIVTLVCDAPEDVRSRIRLGQWAASYRSATRTATGS